MCQQIATVTMKVLETCDLYDVVEPKFRALAKDGDCLGMQRAYRYWLRTRPDIGRSIEASGGKPLERVEDLMTRLSVLCPATQASLEAANDVLEEALRR